MEEKACDERTDEKAGHNPLIGQQQEICAQYKINLVKGDESCARLHISSSFEKAFCQVPPYSAYAEKNAYKKPL